MKVVDFGHGLQYGIVVGKDEFIVMESDFVHFTAPKNEPVKLLVGYDRTEGEPTEEGWRQLFIEDVKQIFTLDELLERAVETKLGVRDDEFGHYWGIKPRVAYNYHLLLGTMREIGADTSAMPEWGA